MRRDTATDCGLRGEERSGVALRVLGSYDNDFLPSTGFVSLLMNLRLHRLLHFLAWRSISSWGLRKNWKCHGIDRLCGPSLCRMEEVPVAGHLVPFSCVCTGNLVVRSLFDLDLDQSAVRSQPLQGRPILIGPLPSSCVFWSSVLRPFCHWTKSYRRRCLAAL